MGTHESRRPPRPHSEIISRLAERTQTRRLLLHAPFSLLSLSAKSVATFSLLERINRRLTERESGAWRRKKLRRSSSAASRRRRSPSGSSSIPPAAKSNTSPKVRILSVFCSFVVFVHTFVWFDRRGSSFRVRLADVRSVLNDDGAYDEAASESFPAYNKAQMICLDLPRRMGEVNL